MFSDPDEINARVLATRFPVVGAISVRWSASVYAPMKRLRAPKMRRLFDRASDEHSCAL
jgi:hypothetical protein